MVLSFRQRLILFHHCDDLLFAEVALWDDDSIDFDCFLKHNVKAKHLLCAEVHINELFKRGVDSIQNLKKLGFDSLHLTCNSFCSSCLEVYGTDATRNGFILTPMDAVAVAGQSATAMLGLTTRQLLELTIGFPQCASAVLQQQVGLMGVREALRGLDVPLMLDCGLRANTFTKCHVTAFHLKEACGCTVGDFERLGY